MNGVSETRFFEAPISPTMAACGKSFWFVSIFFSEKQNSQRMLKRSHKMTFQNSWAHWTGKQAVQRQTRPAWFRFSGETPYMCFDQQHFPLINMKWNRFFKKSDLVIKTPPRLPPRSTSEGQLLPQSKYFTILKYHKRNSEQMQLTLHQEKLLSILVFKKQPMCPRHDSVVIGHTFVTWGSSKKIGTSHKCDPGNECSNIIHKTSVGIGKHQRQYKRTTLFKGNHNVWRTMTTEIKEWMTLLQRGRDKPEGRQRAQYLQGPAIG